MRIGRCGVIAASLIPQASFCLSWEDDMEHSVKVSQLPEKLIFPERLEGRIRYDAAAGRLSFQGFMTKCTYDELSALSDDLEYHRALEQLFVLTSQEIAPQRARRGLPAAILLAMVATVALA